MLITATTNIKMDTIYNPSPWAALVLQMIFMGLLKKHDSYFMRIFCNIIVKYRKKCLHENFQPLATVFIRKTTNTHTYACVSGACNAHMYRLQE